MIFTASKFGAVRIKDSMGQKLKTSALSVSLRLCVKNLLAAALLALLPLGAFAADVTVRVEAGQESFGKVSGGKAIAKEGSSLTLKATPAKGYGFAGWYEGSTRVSWLSTWKHTVTSGTIPTVSAKGLPAGFKLDDVVPRSRRFADGLSADIV